MTLKEIKSLQHPLVKQLVKLRTDRSFRKETKSVFISGKKMVEEIGPYGSISSLFLEEGYTSSTVSKETYLVTKPILKKVSGLENPEPIAAIVDLPKEGDLNGKKWILALDQVSDPGNLGTLIRTAVALGWEGIFLLPGTTDPYNAKALRAAKGATFRIPIKEGSKEDLQDLIENNKMQCFVAEMDGKNVEEVSRTAPILLILGNESNGVRVALTQEPKSVAIAMSEKMESLNVAIAGSLLMYRLKTK